MYVYHLQEMGYTHFIGYNTAQIYWRRRDGQIYNKKNKYDIRCGYSRMILYPHLIGCRHTRAALLKIVGTFYILYQRGRNWLTSYCGGKSKLRSTTTRSGMKKKCCRMCTSPGLSTCRTIRNIWQNK